MTSQVRGQNIESCVVKRMGQLAITSAVFSHAVGDQYVCARFGWFIAKPLAAKYLMTVSRHKAFLSGFVQSDLSFSW